MPGGESVRWIREQQMIASLDMVGFLCGKQCRAIAAAAMHLQRDPIYEDILGEDAFRLSSIAKQLLEEPTDIQGAKMLRLAVTRRLMLQIMDRKDVVIWLARDHPETLTILMNAAGFDGLGLGDIDDVPMPPRTRKRRNRGGSPR